MQTEFQLAVCDWLNKFHGFSLLLITLAIDKMDGRGHIYSACRECLPKKTGVTWYYLQKDYWKDRALHL